MYALTSTVIGAALMLGGLAPAVATAGTAPTDVSAVDCREDGANEPSRFALGSPRRPVDGVPRAGVVVISTKFLGGPVPGATATISSGMVGKPSTPGGAFGSAAEVHRVNSTDACNDLIVGMAGADDGRGGVVVVPGAPTGFLNSSAVWLPTSTLDLKPGDALGSALAVIPVAGGTLVVAGAPGRDLSGAPNAGEVVTWLIPTGGDAFTIPSPAAPATYVQGAGGVLGHAERNDRFGSVLAGATDGTPLVLVGIPKEDIGRRTNAGAVAVLTFTGAELTSNQLLWQGSGLPGRSRTGDRLGEAVATEWSATDGGGRRMLAFAFGVPGKDSNGRKDSGAVIITDPATGRYRVLTQNSKGIPDRSERGDRFGAALVGLSMGYFQHAFAIGAPGEDTRARDTGAVTLIQWGTEDMIPAIAARLLTSRVLAKGDAFGSHLLAPWNDLGDAEDESHDALLSGAPGEDRPGARNAGRYYLTSDWSVTQRLSLTTFSDGVAPNERFGQP